jgi:hypothetical protein
MSDILINVRGTARYPWFNKPDTKFNSAGLYKANIEIDAETAAPLIAQFEAMRAEEAKQYAIAKKGKKAKIEDLPLFAQLDEEGNETGMYELKVKMTASGISKKTNKPWSRKLPLFDGAGKPTNAAVGGGSEVIVSISPKGWTNAKGECSVTCYLEAVQVLQLVTGGQASASRFGFGAVDGAFVAGNEPADRDDDDDAGSEADAEDASSYDFN